MHLIIDGASSLIIYVWYAQKNNWNTYKSHSGELMEHPIGLHCNLVISGSSSVLEEGDHEVVEELGII